MQTQHWWAYGQILGSLLNCPNAYFAYDLTTYRYLKAKVTALCEVFSIQC